MRSASVPPPGATIDEIVRAVTRRFLGDDCVPGASVPGLAQAELLSGLVAIAGPWSGVVSICCTRAVAAHAAETVLGIGPDRSASDAELRDAVGALAAQLGRSLVAQLGASPPGEVSLPIVCDGRASVRATPPPRERSYAFGPEAVFISVIDGGPSSAAGGGPP